MSRSLEKRTAAQWIVTICCVLSLSIPTSAAGLFSAALAVPMQEERENETKSGEGFGSESARDAKSVVRGCRTVARLDSARSRGNSVRPLIVDLRAELAARFTSLRC